MMAPATDAQSSFLDPVLLEIEGVETLSEVDYRFARNFKNEFDPSVSWADPIVMQRFPLHTVVARSYLAAILHEATCEHTFSYTGG
jgi:hypothetical protein